MYFPAYSSSRLIFLRKLQELLVDRFTEFDLLSNLDKTSYMLGSEVWKRDFSYLQVYSSRIVGA